MLPPEGDVPFRYRLRQRAKSE